MVIPTHFPSEPRLIWSYFHQINQIPRPSKKEGPLRAFITEKAASLGLDFKVDEVGNVVVYVLASEGYENHPPVIIQNHMDMVTDHLPSIQINFETDPILTKREGEWIKAQGTTLGADNGIGCAASLSLMEDRSLAHPPLELLFTVDEETGLVGAWGVQREYFKGRRLLNLDTEEWGSFYIGCAGGIDYDLQGDLVQTPVSWEKPEFLKLEVKGFIGGHSGVDIHEQRGNAIKFMNEILLELSVDEFGLHEWRGGKAHNIIPRDTFVVLSGEKGLERKLQEAALRVTDRWMGFLPINDRQFITEISPTEEHDLIITGRELRRVLSFLQVFPHGAHKYDLASHRELVSLSNNLALCFIVRGKFYLLSSLRFFDRQECISLENQVEALGNIFGLKVSKNGEYPSWKPIRENKTLDLVTQTYERMFGKSPKITAIHAGLECGILRDRIGEIEAVSFGPTIHGAHSPDERVNIESVASFWKLLTAVLEAL